MSHQIKITLIVFLALIALVALKISAQPDYCIGNDCYSNGVKVVQISTVTLATNDLSRTLIYACSWDCVSVASQYGIDTNATGFLFGGYAAGQWGAIDCQRALAECKDNLNYGAFFNTNTIAVVTNTVTTWIPAP